MPFLAKDVRPLPTKDILSWYFDDPKFDTNTPIYIDAENPERSYSHKQAKTAIKQIAAGLKAQGLKNGDCVCIHSFNDINYPILVNGIVAAGCIFAGTNPGYTTHELTHAIKAAKVSFIIVEPEILPNILEAARQSNISDSYIRIFDNGLPGQTVPSGFKSWRTLFDHGEVGWQRFDDLSTAKSTIAARLFSSGTTGMPKAALVSHYNLIAQHCMVGEWFPRPYTQRRLIPLPFFHVAVVPAIHFSPLRDGAKTCVMRRFDIDRYLANIQRHQITEISVVPPMVVAILMSELYKKYDLSSVKAAWSGAAPLGAQTQARFQQLIPKDSPFTQLWGMTETTCVAMMFRYPEADTTGSVGRPHPNLDVKLVDDDGKDITGYDVRGEMCIRGPSVITGYLDNAEANRSWDEDGYFHTGDIMYCDGKTRLWYIVDRKKELIKVRGFQVAPPELETVLLEHPRIVDCAVIGVPSNDRSGELPRAYVVKRPGPEGDKLREKDVHAHVGQRLAKYKQLEGGIVFTTSIPKNASGKILKRVLREQAKREMEAKL